MAKVRIRLIMTLARTLVAGLEFILFCKAIATRLYAHTPFCVIIVAVKILAVSQYYYPEGVSFTAMCEGLVKLGHEVLVVTGQPNLGLNRIQEGYEDVVDEVINGVRVHRCKLIPKNSEKGITRYQNYLSFWRSSKKYLSRLKEEFDVVYSQVMSPIISVSGGNIYAKKHHVPHVHLCYDLWPESCVVTGGTKKGSLVYRILFVWSKKIYMRFDKILISSPSFVDYFHDVLNLDKPISYIPQPALLGEDNLPPVEYEKPYNLVYAGNVGTLQLVENLVDAMALLKTKGVVLHIIGQGSRLNAVKEKAKELGIEDRIIVYGPKGRSITQAYFKSATALVVSLHNKGFVGATIPNKLVSSLYYGKPILAVIGGDGEKVLKEAGSAVFSQSEDPKDIAEAIDSLLSLSEEEKEALGDKGRQYFDEHYEVSKIIKAIEAELIEATSK